jgi:radical SAM superfamily enzyme YgiQ (UPF0313 family)
MRVALVKAPRPSAGRILENGESLALGYLASRLRQEGFDASIFNAALRRNPSTWIVQTVLSGGYNVVGFTLSDPELVNSTLRVVLDLRRSGYDGHVTVGGHSATFHADEILAMCEGIDSVVLHEGEETLVDLCRAIERGSAWDELPGMVSRAVSLEKAALRSPLHQLDRLPGPARDDLPWVLANIGPEAATPVLASRGCYFRCGFCSVRAFYERDGRPTWRRRTVSNVIAELTTLASDYGIRDFLFVDDLFLSRSRDTCTYAEDFASSAVECALKASFTISATVDSIRRETLAPLRDAGLRQVFLGAEAADQEILRYLGKWFSPARIAQAAETLEALGIDYTMSFINFTPKTELRHLAANAAFFSQFSTDMIPGLLNRYQVYGGTPLYRELKESGLLVGSFPVLDYVGDDRRVDVLYALCTQTLGPLLELSRSIKKATRIAALQEKVALRGSGRGFASCADLRPLVRQGTLRVNYEVATLFQSMVGYVNERDCFTVGDLDTGFVHQVRDEAAHMQQEWSRVFESLAVVPMCDASATKECEVADE